MSFYFTRFTKHIKQTKLRYDYKREDFNKYLDNLNKSGIEFNKLGLQDHPQNIQNNPYFWSYLTKNKMKEKIKILKRTTDNTSNSTSTSTSQLISKISLENVTAISKKVIKSVYNTLVTFISKVTKGHIDLKKIYDLTQEKISKIPILNKINMTNLVYAKDVAKYLTLVMTQKIVSIIEKNKDSKMNAEAKLYYENLSKKLQSKLENPRNVYIMEKLKLTFRNNFVTNRLYYSDVFKKMNNYINASYIEKKYYLYKQNISNYFGIYSLSGLKEKIMNQYYKFRIIELKKIRSFSDIRGVVRNKFRKILFTILGIILTYYTLKYLFYRMRNRSQDKKLEEAMSLVRELKTQNEALIKFNEELVSKIKI